MAERNARFQAEHGTNTLGASADARPAITVEKRWLRRFASVRHRTPHALLGDSWWRGDVTIAVVRAGQARAPSSMLVRRETKTFAEQRMWSAVAANYDERGRYGTLSHRFATHGRKERAIPS